MANSVFFVAALIASVFLATEAMTVSRVKRQTVAGTPCGCGVQVTFLVLNQTYTVSSATVNDISSIQYVQQVLNYQNYQIPDIQSAITSAYANTLAPLNANQYVDIATQGLTSVSQTLQGNVNPLAASFRNEVLQVNAFLQQYYTVVVNNVQIYLSNGGTLPTLPSTSLPSIGSLPTIGTLPPITLPTLGTIRPVTLPTIGTLPPISLPTIGSFPSFG